MRLLPLTVPLLLVPLALAASGGPDDGDMVYTDSADAAGPSHAWLDATGGDAYALDDDDTVTVDLPFTFDFYGTGWEEATISSNGVLFFTGASPLSAGICPDSAATWTGIAAYWDDLGASTVHTATYGTYPWRTFVVSWDNVSHATAGGSGRFQIWLLEGRNEAVVVLDDTTWGDPTYDNGATAMVGTNGPDGGLPWSCGTAFADGTTVWFGDQSARPDRAVVTTDELDSPWTGQADFDYAGRALASGDVNGDGTDDLLVGTQDRGAGEVSLIYRPDLPSDLGDADATFTGDASGDDFGTTLLVSDLDGDGTGDVLVGAPENDGAGSQAGAAYLWAGGGPAGTYAVATADGSLTGPATGGANAGSAVVTGDVNGDGYPDLIVGAPSEDSGGTNAGAVYVLAGTSALPSGAAPLASSAMATFRGVDASDQLGRRFATGDVDGDGDDDLVLSALFADDGATDAGTIYLVEGGSSWTGAQDVDAVSACTFSTTGPSSRLGDALLLADLDGSGLLDLAVGASTADGTYTDGGKAFVFYEFDAATCPGSTVGADATISGVASSANFGTGMAAGDLDGDGVDDLVVTAPNMAYSASGGGAAYVFTTAPSGTMVASSADHTLAGSGSAGALGTAIAVAATSGGLPALVATAPFDSVSYSSEGAIYDWTWHPDFEDEDEDGYVSALAGGNDCDDADATAYPDGTDAAGDSVDGDCDGWVDGELKVRSVAAEWAWDVDELGASTADVDTYDFESFAEGASITTYADLAFSGTLTARASVWGTAAEGTRAARLLAGTASNELGITFTDPVDAISFRLLDPDDTFTLVATGDSGTVVTGYTFDASADDRASGLYRGFTFAGEVTSITLTGATTDGFGIDDLEVAWATDSDRDGDGYSDAQGDCDDDDDDVSPAATETLGNGIDDDCDGIVDAGNATAYTTEASWTAAAALDATDTIDFEALSFGETATTQYEDDGVVFDGVLRAGGNADGTRAHDSVVAVDTSGTSTTILFDEDQPAVGFWVLDGDVTFTVRAYDDGVLYYTTTFTPASSDAFYGLVFDSTVDELVISASDAWGLDDVAFSTLGLDDADGDGLTEREGDCDDSDPLTYTGADEVWYDGTDEDCLGGDDYDADEDGSDSPTDCDDTDSSVNPSATEVYYDGVDANCDDLSDYDADADGHDDLSWGGDDCDDTDDAVNPDATETWYDGVDQDCAGDDDYDADGDGYATNGAFGFVDCDDTDGTISPGAAETYYDGVDQDCSGDQESDYDADGDGHDSDAWGGDDCEDTEPAAYPGATGERCYDGVDTDCDGANDYDCDDDGYTSDAYGGDDCDDTDATWNPAASDTVGDGLDTNCDGAPDYDFDRDGYDGDAYGGDDCDDTDATVNPGVADACYDGVDLNCDGWSDYDCDLDGYDSDAWGGDDCDDDVGGVNPGVVDFPYDGLDSDCDGGSEYDVDGDGHTTSWYGGDDCDDANDAVYAGASDACYDGVDSDCDDADDDDCDGDGWAAVEQGGLDCDDADAAVSPDATEIADDGVDQDCDGSDDVTCTDCDGDGVDESTDCDDTDPDVYPGAPDAWYDGLDADCVGDDDFDADADGSDASAWGGADCDDADPRKNPANTVDDCQGGDEDCDGTEDEDCDLGGDTAPDDDSGHTGTIDTGDETRDTAEDWRPDPSDVTDPEILERGTRCGCATPGGSPMGAAALGLVALAVARRKK